MAHAIWEIKNSSTISLPLGRNLNYQGGLVVTYTKVLPNFPAVMKRDKRILYPDIYSEFNLHVAHRMARRGKTKYQSVQYFQEHEDECVRNISQILQSGEYKTSKYKHSEINDRGKIRTISKLPYSDVGDVYERFLPQNPRGDPW